MSSLVNPSCQSIKEKIEYLQFFSLDREAKQMHVK